MSAKDVHLIIILKQQWPVLGLHFRGSFLGLDYVLLQFLLLLLHFDNFLLFFAFIFTHVEYYQLLLKISRIYNSVRSYFSYLNFQAKIKSRTLRLHQAIELSNMSKIIIQQINSKNQMAASYNLRHRSKDLTPPSRKHLFLISDDADKISPKTDQKMPIKINNWQKGLNKNQSFVSSGISSVNDLTTNPTSLNDSLIVQQCSNSIIDCGFQLQKIKTTSLISQKHDDQGSSPAFEESALFLQIHPERQIKKSQNEYEVGKERKSYKSVPHSAPLTIPYRKCQTQMQEKIVTILNKIKTKEDKNCGRQIDRLFSKISNVSSKQLRNKYFVSGVKIIMNIVTLPEFREYFQPSLIQKVIQVYQFLRKRVQDQLDNISDFLIVQPKHIQQIDQMKVIKRVFSILRKRYRSEQRKSIQQKTIQLVNQHKMVSSINFKALFQELVCI